MGARSNEQVKLGATLMNTLAAQGVAMGVLTPFALWFADFGKSIDAIQRAKIEIGVCLWLIVGVGLHVVAQLVLRFFEE